MGGRGRGIRQAQLATIEGFMLEHLNTHGMESVRTDGGTFYKQEEIKPNIVDDAAFFAWIKENDAFDAMQRRVKRRLRQGIHGDARDGRRPASRSAASMWCG
jgi:hypothetical protein